MRGAESPKPPLADLPDVLAVIPRGPGPEDLVVHLAEYDGHPYVSLRVFAGGYPQRGKGVSVRLSEAGEVADAIARGLELADSRRRAPSRRVS